MAWARPAAVEEPSTRSVAWQVQPPSQAKSDDPQPLAGNEGKAFLGHVNVTQQGVGLESWSP
eukprot:gene1667-2010_t